MSGLLAKMKHVEEPPQNFEGARQLEQQQEWKKAAALYESLLKQTPGNLKLLHRLMIVYRKLKAPKKELAAIDKAIKILSSYHERKTSIGTAAEAISKKLNNLLGHTDKKGKPLTVSPEVEKLQKRRARVGG